MDVHHVPRVRNAKRDTERPVAGKGRPRAVVVVVVVLAPVLPSVGAVKMFIIQKQPTFGEVVKMEDLRFGGHFRLEYRGRIGA